MDENLAFVYKENSDQFRNVAENVNTICEKLQDEESRIDYILISVFNVKLP